MRQYRKKPIVIEAIRFFGRDKWEQLQELAEGDDLKQFRPRQDDESRDVVDIITLEGTMTANYGDWIIKGVSNEFYPCKDEIFRKTYELVEAN